MTAKEAQQIIEEVHESSYGPHMNAHMLAYCLSIEEDEEKNREGEWYSDILQYLKDGTYPKFADKNDQLTIRRLSTNYIICGERLYKRSYDEIHLI